MIFFEINLEIDMPTVNSNTAAQFALNKMTHTEREMTTAMERLSSGKRINHAGDDAAGAADRSCPRPHSSDGAARSGGTVRLEASRQSRSRSSSPRRASHEATLHEDGLLPDDDVAKVCRSANGGSVERGSRRWSYSPWK